VPRPLRLSWRIGYSLPMNEDKIGRILLESGWPSEGTSAVEIMSRAFKLCSHIERRLSAIYEKYDLTRGEADVLNALTRAGGTPISPRRLADSLMCSGGAMTNRLDRLEDAGRLVRSDDPEDRRGIWLSITRAGRGVIARVNAERTRADRMLVPGLSSEERKLLAALLAKVLHAYEESDSVDPGVTSRTRNTPKKRSRSEKGFNPS
jgi:DNA-binding MarR family transcriptional regulator